jgi:DNA replication and repair protein RecF
MALRLAECAVRLERRHLAPLLLLDDCLEALDRERQQRLIKRLCDYQGQILMTVPNGVEIAEHLTVHPWHLSVQTDRADEMHAVRPATEVVAGDEMERAA